MILMYYLWCLLGESMPMSSGLVMVGFMGDLSLVTEELEHIVFSLVGTLMVLLVWPVLEEGMNSWVVWAVVVISGLLCVSSPLWVYILFELSLVPMVVLIVGWGTQPERITASYYLLVYTLLLSSPLLAGVIMLEELGSLIFSPLLSLLLGMALMVKLPLYFIHIWLPKAHVEAPTSGSILLAGILLKMGSIGLVWSQNYCKCSWGLLVFYCALLGCCMTACVCSFQSDIKALVAYSSVAHMNYIMIVMCLTSVVSDSSSSLLSLGHSFVSSMMLMMAGECFHAFSTRMVYFLRGALLLKEVMTLLLLCVMMGNLAIPPSISLLGEVSSLVSGLSVLWLMGSALVGYFIMVAYLSLLMSLSFVGTSGSVVSGANTNVVCFFIAFSLMDLALFGLY